MLGSGECRGKWDAVTSTGQTPKTRDLLSRVIAMLQKLSRNPHPQAPHHGHYVSSVIE